MFSRKQDLYTIPSKAQETVQNMEQKEYKSWKIRRSATKC